MKRSTPRSFYPTRTAAALSVGCAVIAIDQLYGTMGQHFALLYAIWAVLLFILLEIESK